MDETIRIKLTLAYQGTRFAGWQYQPEECGRSVQAVVEQAVSHLAGRFVRVQGGSRTDAGVHALHQTAHADIPASRAGLPWMRALNALLPNDVAVTAVEPVARNFHARYAPTSKTYSYTLWLHPDFVLPHRHLFVWRVGQLDLTAMEDAAQELTGTHDFAAFQNAGTDVRDTVRRVDFIRRTQGQSQHESVWLIRGPGFLKQMVRNIMGCLVTVGKGKLNRENVRLLLMTKDRSLAPATAPAQGLCLERMEFGQRERQDHNGHIGRDNGHEHPGEEGLGCPGGFVRD